MALSSKQKLREPIIRVPHHRKRWVLPFRPREMLLSQARATASRSGELVSVGKATRAFFQKFT